MSCGYRNNGLDEVLGASDYDRSPCFRPPTSAQIDELICLVEKIARDTAKIANKNSNNHCCRF